MDPAEQKQRINTLTFAALDAQWEAYRLRDEACRFNQAADNLLREAKDLKEEADRVFYERQYSPATDPVSEDAANEI